MIDRILTSRIKHGSYVGNGVDSRIISSEITTIDYSKGLTVEILVKREADVIKEIIYASDSLGAIGAFEIFHIETGQLYIRLNGSNTWTTGYIIPKSKWVRISYTYDLVNQKILVNGKEVASRPQTIVPVNTHKFITIGGYNDGQYSFQGGLDDIRVFTYARTVEQARDNYNLILKPQTGLVAYYKLDSNALDSSGNGYNGTPSVNVSWSTTDIAPDLQKEYLLMSGRKYGSAYVGSSGGIETTTIPPPVDKTRMSLVAWVKTAASGATKTMIQRYSSVGTDIRGMLLLALGNGEIRLDGRPSAGAAYRALGSGVLLTDTWQLVVGTVEGGLWKIYVDGVLKASSDSGVGTYDYWANEPARIGYNKGTNGALSTFLNGNVFNGQIWNRVLTDSEVTELTTKLLPTNRTGLIAHYILDDASGNFAKDSAGGYTGTLRDTTTWAGLIPTPFADKGKLLVSKSKQPFMWKFNGNSYGVIPNSALGRPASISVGVWVNYTTTANVVIIEKGASNDNFLIHTVATSAKIVVANAATQTVASTNALNDGKPHFILATYDSVSKVLNLYVDGKLDGSRTTIDATNNNAADWTLASRNSSLGLYPDMIGEVYVWDKPLTETEGLNLMLKGVKGNEAGLLAWYRPTTENKLIDLVAGRNGSFVAAPKLLPSTAPLGQRSGLKLTRGTGMVTIPANAALEVTTMTLMFWFRLPKYHATHNDIVMELGNDNKGHTIQTGTDAIGTTYGAHAGAGRVFYYNSGLPAQSVGTSQRVDDGKWHFMTITYDGATKVSKMYLDLVFQMEFTCTGTLTVVGKQWTIGARLTGVAGMSGEISNPAILNRVLDLTEIRNNAYRYLPSDFNGLLEQWKLNEGVGLAAYGTKGNNGSISGTAAWTQPSLMNWIGKHLNGANGAIKVATPITGKTDYTLELWYQNKNTTGNNVFLHLGVDGTFTNTLLFIYDDADGLQIDFHGQRGNLGLSYRYNLNWNHFALVKRGTDGLVYYNGTLVMAFSNLAARDITSVLKMFSATTNGFGCIGNADDIRIWKTARTQEEIQRSRPFTLGRDRDLVLNLGFESDYYDSSGHANAVTIIGTPTLDVTDAPINLNAPIN